MGGACDVAFRAESFDEMAELSKRHATEMFARGDDAHLRAAEAMRALMSTPGAFEEWLAGRQREFDALPHE